MSRLRHLYGTAFLALLVAGCSIVGPSPVQPTAQIIYVTAPPAPSVAPSSLTPRAPIVAATTPTVVATPPPAVKPTPKPKPTLRPAVLSVTIDNFTSNTCFTDATDAQGHVLHGGIVTFKATAYNTGQVASGHVWFRVTNTSVFATDSPTIMRSGSTLGFGTHWASGHTLVVPGPQIAAGKTRALGFRVFFQEAYRIDFTIAAVEGGDPDDSTASAALAADPLDQAQEFTTVSIC